MVIGRAADQRVGGGHHAAHAGGPAAPCHRARVSSTTIVPIGATHHIIAVGQRRYEVVLAVVAADLVIGRAADQRVGVGHHAAHPSGHAAPCHRARVSRPRIGPIEAVHHIIAVSQHRHTAGADLVIGRAAGQLADHRQRRAIVEIDRADVRRACAVAGIGDDEVAIGQHSNRCTELDGVGGAGEIGLGGAGGAASRQQHGQRQSGGVEFPMIQEGGALAVCSPTNGGKRPVRCFHICLIRLSVLPKRHG